MTENPIVAIARRQGVMILDGGLATALEARGCDLHDDLWSAKVLLDDREAVRSVARDFLVAGADCILTVTYQATLEGFRRRGLSDGEGVALLERAADLAVEERDAFWDDPANRTHRVRPLVAASVGPYGAFLADGSEYIGAYDIDDDELYAFHRDRWHILAESRVDLLACETIPSLREARALLRLLRETPDRWAWLSVSCRDESHLSDGSPLADLARACDAEPQVAAVGVNCVSPGLASRLVSELRRATTKPVLVYPNSGERYEADGKTWSGTHAFSGTGDDPAEWVRCGATGVGGCCRVSPTEIAELRRHLVG